MFELKYSISDADMKAVNKKMIMFYFVLYLAVAIVGMAIGIVAIVLNPQTLMLVLGIILLVLGAILSACAILLIVAPKNLVASAVPTGETEYSVKVDDDGITVVGEEQTSITYAQISKVKNYKSCLLVCVGKDKALLVKDAITAGGSLDALYQTLAARQGCPVNPLKEIEQSELAEPEVNAIQDEKPAESAAEQVPEAHEDVSVEARAEAQTEEQPVEQPVQAEPEQVEQPAEQQPETGEQYARSETAAVEAENEPVAKPATKKPAAKKPVAEHAAKKPAAKKSAERTTE